MYADKKDNSFKKCKLDHCLECESKTKCKICDTQKNFYLHVGNLQCVDKNSEFEGFFLNDED